MDETQVNPAADDTQVPAAAPEVTEGEVVVEAAPEATEASAEEVTA